MKFFKFKKDQKFISQVVILSMVFGFSAGVVGQIVSDVYLDPWQNGYIYQDTVGTNQNISRVIPELRRVERFLGIQQDFEVNNSVTKVKPAVVGIYLKKSTSAKPLDQVYLPINLQASGFILTNDGWIVTYGNAFKNLNKEDLVVAYDSKIFAVENIIIDSVTEVVFIKIPANNLPVAVLGDSKDMAPGQLGIVLNFLNEIAVTSIKDTDYRLVNSKDDYITSSEKYGKLFLLSDGLNDHYSGSPLVNLGGEVVGVLKEFDAKEGISTVVPINQFRSIILDVLKNNIVKRSYLGIKYLDLAWTVGLDSNLTQNLNKGALVYQKPDSNSPASDIGIEQYDIIISVDGQQVDQDSSLTELIQQYQAGDEVELEILRTGKVLTNSVVLSVLLD
jgi:serine protease Do